MEWSIHARDRVSPLADALRPQIAAVVAVPEPVDPRADLERERAQVLVDAEQRGHANGMQRADDAIAEACRKAEAAIEARHAQALEQAERARRELQQLLSALPDEIERVHADVEHVVADIAFECVARLLGRKVADREAMRALCAQALDEFRQRPVVLKVATDVIDTVAPLTSGDVQVFADAALAPGACRLESPQGAYDTSLQMRLSAVHDALHSARQQAATP